MQNEVLKALEKSHPKLFVRLRHAIETFVLMDHDITDHQFNSAILAKLAARRSDSRQDALMVTSEIRQQLVRDGMDANFAATTSVDLYQEIKEGMERKIGHRPADSERWMWIIAGPNGAGKSTFVESPFGSLAGEIPLVNPDIIAFNLNPDDIHGAAGAAGRIAVEKMQNYASVGRSFMVETTLSGTHHLRLAKRLKEAGWHIGCVFISNNSPEISQQRVTDRVKKGGHYVPPADIARRWQRAHENVPYIFELADRAYVIDNSTSLGFKLTASGGEGKLFRINRLQLDSFMNTLEEKGLLKHLSEADIDVPKALTDILPDEGKDAPRTPSH